MDRMLEYYELLLEVYPMEIRQLDSPKFQDVAITNYPDYSISSATNFVSFDLKSVGHQRPIRSFKVVVGEFSKLQIGWRNRIYEPDSPFSVGYTNYSIAVNIAHKSRVYSGSEAVHESLNQVEAGKTILLFEMDTTTPVLSHRFTWSLISEDAYEPVEKYSMHAHCRSIPLDLVYESPVPCISVKGSIRVVDITYY